MRSLTVLIGTIIILILTLGCEKNENDIEIEIKDGFSLIFDDSVVYNSNSIDFYDFSSHLIYLKAGNIYSYTNRGTFKIQVDNEEIYTGQMFHWLSRYLPFGSYIRCGSTFYNDYIIPIEYNPMVDDEGIYNDDPRNDSRIIDALKKYNQYREGLSSEIISVQKLSDGKIKITLELTNLDSDNLLYLDPDKMGLGLFHFFTNGLVIRDTQNNVHSHKIAFQVPAPWNYWTTDWLTVINGKETKTITIIYDDFDLLPSGIYTASFNFPGLTLQIGKEELQQNNGRIWLGELINTKVIAIE